MDEVWVEAASQTPEIEGQSWQVAPAEFASPASPVNLVDFLRQGPVFGLTATTREAHIKQLMLRPRQCGEEAMIMGTIAV